VSGVIASANVVAGQVVDARELIFEIVDPSRLRIEALGLRRRHRSNIGSRDDGRGQPACAAHLHRRLAQPARAGAAAGLPRPGCRTQPAGGRPAGARVRADPKDKVKGISVPVASLMKNPANQTVVWVKTAPERFEPRTVTTEPLDGVNAAVTSGLEPGDRVATQGATLINQVR
jgi:cobalt-zinc-cadmium efflux system membrane fusion protein